MGVVVLAIFTVLILARRRNKKAVAPVDKDGKACYVSLHHKLMRWKSFLVKEICHELSACRPTLFSRPAPSPLLNAPGIFSVSVEEIHVATNNLGESNFIGEGTAGMNECL